MNCIEKNVKRVQVIAFVSSLVALCISLFILNGVGNKKQVTNTVTVPSAAGFSFLPKATKKPKTSVKTTQTLRVKGCDWSSETLKRVKRICERRGLSFNLAMAMAFTESRFDGKDIGDNGLAYGAWQIHPNEWMEEISRFGYDKSDMLDVCKQAHVLAYLMQAHLDKFDGDERGALMAWNGGSEYAAEMLENGKVSEYAKEILINKERIMKGRECIGD